MRDMLWLRILAIVSSLVFWIAAMAADNWITATCFWNGVFIAINTYNIGVLLNENRSVSFTDEEQELYETLFRSFRPGEFQRSFASPSGGMRRPESYSYGRVVRWMASV